jgi:F420-dependent oxidoreductase-like protein
MKMDIGVQTPLSDVEWPALESFWRFLDRETAFHNAWTYDHFVPPMPGQDPRGPSLEGWTALAGLATVTERLRIGCLVTGVTYREPAVLAKMAATVDHMSGGRLELGIGAAWHEAEHRFYGMPFPAIRERQDRLEEAVQLIRLLFSTGSTVDFRGEYYRLEQAPFAPPCLQSPHPPIFVAGGGEKRTLRTAARHGDAINVVGSVSVVRHKIEVLDRHCAEAGRDPNEITKSVFGPIILVDAEAQAERIRTALATGFGIGADEAATDLPIGSANHVRKALERYAEAGVTYYIAMTQSPFDHAAFKRISDEVVSAFA